MNDWNSGWIFHDSAKPGKTLQGSNSILLTCRERGRRLEAGLHSKSALVAVWIWGSIKPQGTVGMSPSCTSLHHSPVGTCGLWGFGSPCPPLGITAPGWNGPILGMGRNWWPRLVLLLNEGNWVGLSGYAHRAVSGTVSRREGASHWHPFWSPFSSPWCPAPLMPRAFPPAVLHLFLPAGRQGTAAGHSRIPVGYPCHGFPGTWVKSLN